VKGLATGLTRVAPASAPLCLIWRTDLTSPARPAAAPRTNHVAV